MTRTKKKTKYTNDVAYLAVGSPGYDLISGNETNEGRVYPILSGRLIIDFPQNVIGDESGSSVVLSSDGSRVAIGSPTKFFERGSVSMYMKTPRNEWYQLGDEINGTSTGDRFGQTLSFTRDGLELAIGAHSANETSGYVKIYQHQIAKSSWNEIQHLNSSSSDNDQDCYGKAIAFSGNGEFLFVGAPGFSDGHGHVEAYKRLSDTFPFLFIWNDNDG